MPVYRPHRYGKAPQRPQSQTGAVPFLTTRARQSTRRGRTGRRLLSRRLLGRRSRRTRGGGRSHARFTAAVHHAHFSSAALAHRGTHLGVRYADAIDQLTSQATSLANWNDRIVRLLKWDVRHTLCRGHNAQRERNDGGSDHCFSPVVTEKDAGYHSPVVGHLI